MVISTLQIDELADGIFGALVSRGKIGISAMELVLNDACNLSCSYCFETKKTSRRFMSYEIGREAIDRLLHIRDGRKILYFFGGEPFLSWGVMRDLILYSRNLEPENDLLGMSVTTNGTVIPKDAVALINNNQVGVLVSIDPGKDAHDRHRIFKTGRGSYDLVWKNLRHLINNGVYTSVRVTVQPGYTDGLVDLVESCIDAGVMDVIIGASLPSNWDESSISAYVAALERLSIIEKESREKNVSHVKIFDDYKSSVKTCAAGSTLLAVSPEGKLYGCSRLLMADGGKGVACLGNIKNFSLDSSAQKLIKNGTKLSGCAAVNFDSHGDVLHASKNLIALDDALRIISKKFHMQ